MDNTENTIITEAPAETEERKKPKKLRKPKKKKERIFDGDPEELTGLAVGEKRESYWYLCAAFFLPLAVMYLIYIGMEVFPFGKNSVLVLDLNGQYVYYFEAFRKILYEGGSLLYSWTRSLGGELLGIFAYYLCSPFTLIVALFPENMMTEALLVLILCKTGMCGLCMALYLRLSRGVKQYTAVLFGLLYAVCAYGVVQTMNTMWIDAMYLFPLVMLGLEYLTAGKNPALYCITLAVLFLTNYYIGFMTSIFMVLYFFWCTCGRNETTFGKFMKAGLRFALYSLIAAAIASILIIPAYYGLTFGKTTFQKTDYSFFQRFDFLDFLAKMMPASYDTVRPEGLPFVYSGMLTLIFTPLYFLAPGIRPKQKVWSGILTVLLVMSMNASTVDIFWHGLSKPNWLNYRYSFMFCCFLIALAAEAFSHFESALPGVEDGKASPRIAFSRVLTVALALFLIILMIQKEKYEYIDDIGSVWLALGALGGYLIILHPISAGKYQNCAKVFLLIACCAELFGSGLLDMISLDHDVVFSDRNPYANFMKRFRPVVDEINDLGGDGLYRVEKTVHRKVNDNMALGIRGISHSSSDLNAASILFLNQLGYASRSHWSKYAGGTPVADSLLGIRYLIAEEEISDLYTQVAEGDELFAYENPYALGILYTVSEAVQEYDPAEGDTPFERMNDIVTAMLGEKKTIELFKPIRLSSTDYNNCDYGFTTGHRKYSPENENRSASIIYTLSAPTEDEIFVYFPTDWLREVTLDLNGEDYGTYFGKETHRILSLGHYLPKEELTLQLTLKEDAVYIGTGVDYFWYLDEELFREVMPRLVSQSADVSSWDDTHIRCNVRSDTENTRLFTSIPYDEGWKVKVDGKEAAVTETLGALLSVDLTPFGEGEHRVEIRYMPDCYVIGFFLSMGGIGLLVICLLLHFVFQRTALLEKETVRDTPDDEDDDTSVMSLAALLESIETETLPDAAGEGESDIRTDSTAEREADVRTDSTAEKEADVRTDSTEEKESDIRTDSTVEKEAETEPETPSAAEQPAQGTGDTAAEIEALLPDIEALLDKQENEAENGGSGN